MLSESAIVYYFGRTKPQMMVDPDPTTGAPNYKGYAMPGIPTNQPGWLIEKYTLDANGNPTAESGFKYNGIWDLRAIYF